MKLGDLVARVPGAVLHADPELVVTDVTHDSRRVGPGALFVAIHGLTTDGNVYTDAARRKGALAVASEQPPQAHLPWVRVRDAREALALLSAAILGEPASHLELVGVTGTNGKTTTAYLIDAALRAAGKRVGLVGTVQYRIGDRIADAVRTTPESSDLQKLLREMREARCTHAVLEVSSHSLVLKRVLGCPFRVAVFTNLTRDHLDFHGDMDGYFAAKRILFESLLRPDGFAVVNLDDDKGDEVVHASPGKVITYAIERHADVRGEGIALSLSGTSFRAVTSSGNHEIRSPLLGRFNVLNMLAALGASMALGLPTETAIRGIESLAGVPGRMERVDAGQDFTVVVDYAHTDDALRNLLETVRELHPKRVITVFGCGGDRDRTKRPLMGAVAARLSDVVVVTSDNPRSESPEAILAQIQSGMNGGRGRGPERHVIEDRREAIAKALELARKGDAVVIAGKGHESSQVLRDRTVPFDDRQVARDLLSRPAVRGGRA
jgi:UDP-N-acetylmuramoyl-L-alanyl-D-glutamate--2,6-diaminopimelate ligase